MRLLPRSPTNSRPLESRAMACGVSNSPGVVPFLPQVLMNFPSFENFTMRALESPPCPSATKMSPFGAVVTSDGRLKVSGPSPATPALPSVSKTFPLALNLTTWWPLPSFPSASVHMDAVRKHEHPRAEGLEDPARWIQLDHGPHVRAGAGIRAAPLENPDVAVAIDVDRARLSPLPSVGVLRPAVLAVVLGLGSRSQHDDRCGEGRP